MENPCRMMKTPASCRLRAGTIPALALAVLAAPALAAEPASFFEGFDRLSPGRWYVSDGWTNGAHQNCTWSKRAVGLKDGMLTLSYLPDATGGGKNRCSEIQSKDRFGHGTFEARVRTNHSHSGMNAAFFTYIGEVHKKPHDEIDFEILTKDTGAVEVNTYVDGEPQHHKVVPLPQAADEEFHIFSFIWEPDRLRWFVDGTLVHEAVGPLPENTQKIFFSHWSTDQLTDWMGSFTLPDAPLMMEVDWVSYTSPGETCPFPDSVLCKLDE